jgi:hypothetical protein
MPVDLQQFWRMVEAAKASGGEDCYRQAELLQEALRRLPPTDIVAFEAILDRLMGQSKRIELWGAADLIVNECSEDRFEYFRCWLIAQGRQVYEAALADPDSLADYPGLGDGTSVDEVVLGFVGFEVGSSPEREHGTLRGPPSPRRRTPDARLPPAWCGRRDR